MDGSTFSYCIETCRRAAAQTKQQNNMRKQLFSLALLLLAGLGLAHGQTINYDFSAVCPSGDTLFYKINSDSATVSVVNPNYSYHYKPSGNLVIPPSVPYGGVGYTVTTIGNCTFRFCDMLLSATLPITITTIGDSAFFWCFKLLNLIVPDSVTSIGSAAFDGLPNVIIPSTSSTDTYGARCINGFIENGFIYSDSSRDDLRAYVGNAADVAIPESVTRIGNLAFYEQDSIVTLTITQNVETIGKNAFQACRSLSVVYFNADSCYNIGDVRTVGYSTYWNPAFGWNRNLRTIIIGDSVKIIPPYAFSMCDSLRSVSLGTSLQSIGYSAFGGCTNVESVILRSSTPPDVLWDFFYGNQNFGSATKYYVPCGALNTYHNADGWYSLTNIFQSPDCGNTYYDFYATSYGNRLYYKILDSSRVMVVHPLEFDSVGNSFWTGYVQPTGRLVIPDSVVYNNVTYTVTKVGDEAFMNCLGITSLWISNSIDTIERKAFAFDFMIDETSWPISLLYMGDSAFFGCGRIEITIIIPPEYSGPTPSVGAWIGGGAFGGCNFSSFTYGGSTIGYGTYSGNSYLNYFYYSGVLTTIDDNAFDGCEGLTVFTHIAGIPEVRIPRTMQSVGNAAFGHCIAITRVRYDADSCYRMGSDTLPVFMNDWNISLLTIGEHVRWIPSYAFLGCTGLDTIKSYSMVAPELGVDVFSDIPANIPVYIPCGSLESYTSRWPHFTNFIEMYDGRLTAHSADTTRGTVSVTTQPSCRASGVVVATPKYGYHFASWNDGDTTNPRSISVPDSATVALTAHFDINEYSLTVVCDNALGTVSGNGQYLHGATASVTVSPNYGYIFNHWAGLPQQDLPVDSTSVEVSFIMYEDVELTALFDTMHFTLTLSANNPDWGTVDGGGEYAYGTEVTITATANEGYLFSGWSDGNEENPRTMVVTEDMALTANFAEQTGIDALANGIIRVAPNPTSGLLTIQSDDVQQIEVYDLGGRKVLHFGHTNSIDLSVLPSGTYYLHITCPQGTSVAKVVKQ